MGGRAAVANKIQEEPAGQCKKLSTGRSYSWPPSPASETGIFLMCKPKHPTLHTLTKCWEYVVLFPPLAMDTLWS